MAWWEGQSLACESDTCVSASYFNSILTMLETAWDCVVCGQEAMPVISEKTADTDEVCASDFTDLVSAMSTLDTYAALKANCDCTWSNITGCETWTAPASGDPVCACDFECIYDRLSCYTTVDCCYCEGWAYDLCTGTPTEDDASYQYDLCTGTPTPPPAENSYQYDACGGTPTPPPAENSYQYDACGGTPTPPPVETNWGYDACV